MTTGISLLRMRARLSPEATRAEILSALDAVEGNVTRAAVGLRVNYRTLLRVLTELALWDEVDRRYERPGSSARGPVPGGHSGRRPGMTGMS